jgi:hypothetical protein
MKKQTNEQDARSTSDVLPATPVQDRIFTVRGEKVILDSDLAEIYGVETKRLNEQVRRNAERFPSDFSFVLTQQEVTNLRSQIATSSFHGGRRKIPRVFTEHGAIMAATVLNSAEAIQMSVFVVRAFTKMRAALSDTRELARKLATLESEVKSRLDSHDSAIVDVMQRILDLIDPPDTTEAPAPPKREIGFGVRERRAAYGKQTRKQA